VAHRVAARGPQLDLRLLGVRLSVLLLLDRLDVGRAVRRLVNYPRCLSLAAPFRPFALANRHRPPRAVVGNMSQYVAVFPLPFKRPEMPVHRHRSGVWVGGAPPRSAGTKGRSLLILKVTPSFPRVRI